MRTAIPLIIKDFNEKRRTISGIASAAVVDRVGDIIEPFGAKFAESIPLLWQHDHSKPVGTARLGKATSSGIPFVAHLPVIDEPGSLKDYVDGAWFAIKAKLVKNVSIGFRALNGAI